MFGYDRFTVFIYYNDGVGTSIQMVLLIIFSDQVLGLYEKLFSWVDYGPFINRNTNMNKTYWRSNKKQVTIN